MWLYIPTSHCSPASQDLTSDSTPDLNTLASMLSQHVMSRSEFKTAKSWQRELKTAASHPLLSGVTSRHSAGISLTGKLTGLSGDSHALQRELSSLQKEGIDPLNLWLLEIPCSLISDDGAELPQPCQETEPNCCGYLELACQESLPPESIRSMSGTELQNGIISAGNTPESLPPLHGSKQNNLITRILRVKLYHLRGIAEIQKSSGGLSGDTLLMDGEGIERGGQTGVQSSFAVGPMSLTPCSRPLNPQDSTLLKSRTGLPLNFTSPIPTFTPSLSHSENMPTEKPCLDLHYPSAGNSHKHYSTDGFLEMGTEAKKCGVGRPLRQAKRLRLVWLYLHKELSDRLRQSHTLSVRQLASLRDGQLISAEPISSEFTTVAARPLSKAITDGNLSESPSLLALDESTISPSMKMSLMSLMARLSTTAKTYPAPEPAQAWTIQDPVSGANSLASFANFNPAESSSKTSALFSTLFEMNEPESSQTQRPVTFSETWPISGSMRSGVCFQRKRLGLRTPGKDGSALGGNGAWPSARAEDAESCGNHPGAIDSLTGAASEWRTPNTRDHHAQGPRMGADQRQITLVDQALKWATPNQRDQKNPNMEDSGNYQRKVQAGWTIDLNDQAANWNTPSSRDHVSDGPAVAARVEAGKMLTTDQRLRNQVQNWMTPRGHEVGDWQNQKNGETILTCTGQAKQWQTPELWGTPNAHERTFDKRDVDHGKQLANQVDMWQTPATDSFRSRGGDRKDEMGLDQQAQNFGETWPTPCANEDNKSLEAHLAMKKRMGERDGTGANRTAITSLQVMANAWQGQWPTPRTTDEAAGRGAIVSGGTFYRPSKDFSSGLKVGQANLSDVTECWSTPNNHDGTGARGKGFELTDGHYKPHDLVSSVEQWPTPNVPNGGRTSNTTNTREDGSKRQVDLAALAQVWPTPATRDYKAASNSELHVTEAGTGRMHMDQLPNYVEHGWKEPASHFSPPDHQAPLGKTCWCGTQNCDLPSHKRKLNPLFDEILMGWPLNWTSRTARIGYGPAGMELYRRRLAVLLSYLCGGLD